MLGVIYKITNLLNGKSYIGQTVDFERRKKDHLKAKDNYAIHAAIQKYGQEKFSWEVIEDNIPKELLNERESFWIEYYNTYSDGYNETKGGDDAAHLVQWIHDNKNQHVEQALKNLEKAQQSNELNRERHLTQLASVRQKGINKTKRRVKCIEKDLIFESLAEAERWSMSEENDNHKKANHQHISKVCSGKRKTCGGYHWTYL